MFFIKSRLIATFLLISIAVMTNAQHLVRKEASPAPTYKVNIPIFAIEKPQTEPLQLNVTLNDNKPVESWYVPSAGTAAFLTLVISNIVAILVFFLTANHQKKMRKIEADAKVKEQLYLEVAESLASTIKTFGKLFSAKPDEFFAALSDSKIAATTYKLNLIATDDTLEKMTNFSNTWGRASFELAAKGATIEILNQKAERLSQMIQETLENQKRLIARWRETPENLRAPSLIADYSNEFDNLQSEYKKLSDDRNECWNKLSLNRHELTNEGIAKMRSITYAMIEVCLALRQELEQPINADAYRARSITAFEEFEKTMAKFKTDIEAAYDNA